MENDPFTSPQLETSGDTVHSPYGHYGDLETITEGLEAKAYDLRLDEGSYLRLMQRLNLEPKPYVPDDYWEDPEPALSSHGSTDQEQTTSNHDLNRAPRGQLSKQPRGHHIAAITNLRYPTQFDPVVPTLDPAPTGRHRDRSNLSLTPSLRGKDHDQL
ncbi:predicted protein [Sclerotinia sclerotiorum 1980 UF-70]|uniref:Uncharacterized protein n=2 Tax=Sclerotinia sclerotiorum (strain ATCC 18683 / 1980 / Ss-1) TaxID=665079 RepID=A7EIP5_SCLS1|nr:predicted protein [Sclerotinia sclerotiorum 1980 UF-70]APA11710.1 hypothetical protein sscle_08g064800 [Sclerotinia sclerotiorum 1980 UF-70]EDO02711.1 predicted protein [Sclerotinia sclerotiorum 1980 UF-70]